MNDLVLEWRVFDTLEGKTTAGVYHRMNAARKPAHQDQDAFFAALGRRIKELRKERGWSLSYMHIRHGYVPSQWQRFERGKSVTIGSLLKMAEIFDLDLSALIDSLGKFPRKAMEDVAADPAIPKIIERTMTKAASKRSKAKQIPGA